MVCGGKYPAVTTHITDRKGQNFACGLQSEEQTIMLLIKPDV